MAHFGISFCAAVCCLCLLGPILVTLGGVSTLSGPIYSTQTSKYSHDLKKWDTKYHDQFKKAEFYIEGRGHMKHVSNQIPEFITQFLQKNQMYQHKVDALGFMHDGMPQKVHTIKFDDSHVETLQLKTKSDKDSTNIELKYNPMQVQSKSPYHFDCTLTEKCNDQCVKICMKNKCAESEGKVDEEKGVCNIRMLAEELCMQVAYHENVKRWEPYDQQ